MSRDQVLKLLAFNIKRLRAIRGITGDQLAEKADLSCGYVRQVETRRSWVSAKSLGAIAKALKVPVHELFLDKRYRD